MPAQLLRTLQESDITCPAGHVSGDAGCYCGIERDVIDGRTSPDSVAAYCLGIYVECPTWKKQRDAEFKGEPGLVELMDDAETRRRGQRAANQAKTDRRLRAEALMRSNTVEGRKYRAKIAAIVDGVARVR